MTSLSYEIMERHVGKKHIEEFKKEVRLVTLKEVEDKVIPKIVEDIINLINRIEWKNGTGDLVVREEEWDTFREVIKLRSWNIRKECFGEVKK